MTSAPEHAETARTKEISVTEHHDQLHIAVAYEGGEDYILIDRDRVAELLGQLEPYAPDWVEKTYLGR